MKIFCIGRNYSEHAKELNNPIPSRPIVFMKPPTALLKQGKPFYYPDFSKNIQYEAEIVVKIGKNGKCIQEKFAHKYIDGISIGIDFTARDIQHELKSKGHPWEIAKAFDSSAVIGQFIHQDKLDSIPFELHKNGNVVQKGNTADMIFSIHHLIHYISSYFTLQMGDLIYTGTPSGVGNVQIGDVLEGFLDGTKYMHVEIK